MACRPVIGNSTEWLPQSACALDQSPTRQTEWRPRAPPNVAPTHACVSARASTRYGRVDVYAATNRTTTGCTNVDNNTYVYHIHVTEAVPVPCIHTHVHNVAGWPHDQVRVVAALHPNRTPDRVGGLSGVHANGLLYELRECVAQVRESVLSCIGTFAQPPCAGRQKR